MVKRKEFGKMVGFKKYLLWCENKYGQSVPTSMKTADTISEAKKKAKAYKCKHVYIIKVKDVLARQ